MYRLIFYIIALIISLLLPDSRYENRRYSGLFGRRRYNRYFNFYEDDFEGGMTLYSNETNGLSAWIRAKLRRRKALKACKKYLSKDKYILTLKNSNVIVVFDTQNEVLSGVDLQIKGRAISVVWAEQPESLIHNYNNLFEKTFDNICISFNDKANFNGIAKILKENFKVQETNPQKPSTKARKVQEEKPIKIEKYIKKTDINSADENALAKLPGISIILAKRIIKYRDLNGGFRNLEHFYKEMKIKPHFQKQLNSIICANEQTKNSGTDNDTERIIDL